MQSIKFSKLLASLSFFACASLSAAPLVVDVAGIQNFGTAGDAANTVRSYQVGANATITSVSYDVNVTAFWPSYLVEIGLVFEDSAQTESRTLFPSEESDIFPGTATYTGFVDLVDLGLSFKVGADGILSLEFFDDYDDFDGADSQWNFGNITFGIEPASSDVPEPATLLLMGAGLGVLGYTTRRRRTVGSRAA